MTVRFFMLQSNYSSTLDFSNVALKAAIKGYKKLINGLRIIQEMQYETPDVGSPVNEELVIQIRKNIDSCHEAMNDNFNTALTIGHLFTLLKRINALHNGVLPFSEVGAETFKKLKETYINFIVNVLGLKEEKPENISQFLLALIELYKDAKFNRQYEKVDKIRASLKASGIVSKAMETGIEWA